ncbi:MAG: substrate-binding domain-containing protein [Synechococcaceae cyanobacterium]|nr:substrate-binding domain-containing protein [Synechococcaceae cyanobacterium]
MIRRFSRLRPAAALLLAGSGLAGLIPGAGLAAGGTPGVSAASARVGLITRSERNPYFLVLRRAAQQEAERQGLTLLHEAPTGAAGDHGGAGDTAAQAAAVDRLLAAGVRVILITPSDSRAIVPALRRARERGVLVIAVDTPTEPASAVDATVSSDNRAAGRLIGTYARLAWAARGRGRPARIALLDLFAGNAVSEQRRSGFLEGFGLSPTAAAASAGNNAGANGIVRCRADSDGNRSRAEAAMRACMKAAGKDPFDVVYAVNEPAAAGAATALESAGLARGTILVTVDGSCLGVRAVAGGLFAATVQQYPVAMANAGITVAADWIRSGRRPEAVIRSGVSLVTARPQPGLEAIDLKDGLAGCWGGIPDTADGLPLLVYPENRRSVEEAEAAAATLNRQGESAFASLHRPASGGGVFVLDGQGDPLLLPAGSPRPAALSPAEQQRLRPRLAEIASSATGRGWVHARLQPDAAGDDSWISLYLIRTITPRGRTLLVAAGSPGSRIENAFVVEEVEAAAELLRRRGRAAFATLRDPRGRFLFRDVYVFVDDSSGTELVNPAFPALEGRNLIDLRDAEGKEVVRDQLLQALRNGSGWSSSLWPRPGSRLPVRKLTYVRQVVTPEGETLVVGAGVYEAPGPPAPPRR